MAAALAARIPLSLPDGCSSRASSAPIGEETTLRTKTMSRGGARRSSGHIMTMYAARASTS